MSVKTRKPGTVSLDRALSKLGLASRTQARALIEAGRVRVNGIVRSSTAFAVRPETAKIEIDGAKVEAPGYRTLLLHKPRGVVTTRSDEKGRKTVFSLVEGQGHLNAVGRLDLATTGLLLLTNDTRLADWMMNPENAVPRVYLASVRGEVTPAELEKLRAGVEDRGQTLMADAVELRKASGKESHLVVRLHEGKNREVRRLFESVGHEVTRLKRVELGGLTLGELEPGQWREVSVDELRRAFPGAPVRERD